MNRRDSQPEGRPVPLIDAARCTGCALCVKACPSGALAMHGSLAIVARPQACQYHGLCEMICPTHAISRPFQIVGAEAGDAEDRRSRAGEGQTQPTKVGD